MAFLDRTAETGTAKFFYLRISGLPYIWSNIPLPSSWLSGPRTITVDGEQYTTSARLVTDERWAALAEQAQPWSGLGISTQLDFKFQMMGSAHGLIDITDPWQVLLAGSTRRAGIPPRLTANLEPGDTTATLDRAPGAGGVYYIGGETVTAIPSGSTLTSVTRSRYGSHDWFHVADVDQVLEVASGGAYVTTYPHSIAGRYVELWMGTGYPTLRGMLPFGSAAFSSEDKCIWSGVIRKAKPKKLAMTLQAEGIRGELARECCTRLPRGEAYNPDFAFFINGDNNRISWRWWYNGTGSGNGTAEFNVALRNSGGDLADGWYTLSEIREALNYTIANGRRPTGVAASDLHTTLDVDGEGAYKVVCWSAYSGTPAGNEWSLELDDVNARGSFWKSLGFTESVNQEESGNPSAPWSWVVTAQQARPRFFLPKSRRTGWQIAVREKIRDLPFVASPGFLDDNLQSVGGYIRIGDEIVEITARTTVNLDSGYPFTALTLGRRGRFGSKAAEIYEERDNDSEPVRIVQGACFPGTSWGRAAAYLATCLAGGIDNGPFDRGWRGMGAAIPADLIDASSWVATARRTVGRRDIAIFEPTRLDTLLARWLVPSQAVIIPRPDDSSARPYSMQALAITPPLEHEGLVATELTQRNIRTFDAELEWEADETAVISQVPAKEIGFDHGRQGAGFTATIVNPTAKASWPDSRALDIDLRDISSVAEALALAKSFGALIAANYGVPFLVMTIPISSPVVAWDLEVGDIVKITHPNVLRRVLPGRGVTDLLGRVYGIERRYNGAIPGFALVIAQEDGRRHGGYAPVAKVNALSGGNTTLTCDDHWYSWDQDPKDVLRFAADYKVRLYNPGNEAGAEVRTVDSIVDNPGADASQIVLTVATSLSLPIVVEFAKYNTAGLHEDQRAWACISDGSGQLDRGDGTFDPAYEYS